MLKGFTVIWMYDWDFRLEDHLMLPKNSKNFYMREIQSQRRIKKVSLKGGNVEKDYFRRVRGGELGVHNKVQLFTGSNKWGRLATVCTQIIWMSGFLKFSYCIIKRRVIKFESSSSFFASLSISKGEIFPIPTQVIQKH